VKKLSRKKTSIETSTISKKEVARRGKRIIVEGGREAVREEHLRRINVDIGIRRRLGEDGSGGRSENHRIDLLSMKRIGYRIDGWGKGRS
jgi:hypothetical protein